MNRSGVAYASTSAGETASAVTTVDLDRVAASLVVLAHAAAAETVAGDLLDPARGTRATVSLPWRAPFSVLRATVERQLAPSRGGREGGRLPVVIEVRCAGGPTILVTGRHVEPSADAALLRGRVERILGCAADRPIGAIDLRCDEDDRIEASAHRPRQSPISMIPSLVRAQAAARPDAVAVQDARRQVSYAALIAAADRYVGRLRGLGIGPGDVVAVGLARRADLVATLLAVWSLRAAFLPVDPAHPPARLASVVAGAGARYAVLAGPPPEQLAGCRVVPPPDGVPHADGEHPPPVPAEPAGTDLAYAMATSGSTGRPKVVGVPHAALAHCVTTLAGLLGLETPTVAGSTALTFDISLLELFLPLATGGRLLLVDDALRRDPARLGAHLSAGRPDLIQATPSGWRMLLPHLPPGLDGITLLCGGEAVTAGLARRLVGTGAAVWNVYGPTEATIWCTAHRLREPLADPVPIGTPLPGSTAAVVGRDGRPVPVGRTGELHIGGSQLAVGYLGDPDRTAAAFRDGTYRTGDLCAWRTDGTLTYHGRLDNQVKIRGHRVELEEIETYAERHPAVVQAAAVVVEAAAGDQRLVLYVQATASPEHLDPTLRAHLAASLPGPLLPQRIIPVPELPLTSSQKVDRKALRDAAQEHVRRHTATEEAP